jgi:hypothetical protein
LPPCEVSVTQRGDVVTSVAGEVAPEREKGVDETRWADTNLTESKIKKIYTVDSVATNG